MCESERQDLHGNTTCVLEDDTKEDTEGMTQNSLLY